jgi:hypothetical protein
MQAQSVIRGKALLNLNLGATGGWEVKATPRMLYHGALCIGRCAGPRACLDGCGVEKFPAPIKMLRRPSYCCRNLLR